MGNDWFDKARSQFSKFWQAMSWSQRSMVLAAPFVALGAVSLVVWLATRDRMVPLYAQLTRQDAAQVTQRLDEWGVSYEFGPAGNENVMVPSGRRSELRIRLAGEDLPRGRSLDEMDPVGPFGADSELTRTRRIARLEMELQEGIEGYAPVQAARIKLAITDKSPFYRERSPNTASVQVQLFPGRTLSEQQVSSIVQHVAHAVEELHPDRVALSDTTGRVYRDGSAQGPMERLNDRVLEHKRHLDAEVEAKILAVLTPLVGGPERLRVRAHHVLDPVEEAITENVVDPERVAVAKEVKSTESSTDPAAVGVPGAAANLAAGGAAPVAGGSESKTTTTDFQVSTSAVTRHVPGGKVVRLSVSVVVDDAFEITVDEEGAEQEGWRGRSAEELGKYESLVRAAAGIDADRGDTLTVENVRFDRTEIEREQRELAEAGKWKTYASLAYYPSLVLGGLLFFLLIVKPILRTLVDPIRQVHRDMQAEEARVQEEARREAEAAQAAEAEEEVEEEAPLERSAREALERNPEQAAELIRLWVVGGGGR